jgi:hypothetical protein
MAGTVGSRSRMTRAVLAVALIASAPAHAAVADDAKPAPSAEPLLPPAPAPSPVPAGPERAAAAVTFEKARIWSDAVDELWRVVDRDGRAICELPCSTHVPPGSGYALEGVGVFATPSGTREMGKPLRLSLPELGPGAPVLRARPGRGSPTGALALGLASAVLFAFGAGVFVDAEVQSSQSSGGQGGGPAIGVAFGATAGAVGILGGIAALVWGVTSARPAVEVVPPSGVQAQGSARIRMAPSGIVTSFW